MGLVGGQRGFFDKKTALPPCQTHLHTKPGMHRAAILAFSSIIHYIPMFLAKTATFGTYRTGGFSRRFF